MTVEFKAGFHRAALSEKASRRLVFRCVIIIIITIIITIIIITITITVIVIIITIIIIIIVDIIIIIIISSSSSSRSSSSSSSFICLSSTLLIPSLTSVAELDLPSDRSEGVLIETTYCISGACCTTDVCVLPALPSSLITMVTTHDLFCDWSQAGTE